MRRGDVRDVEALHDDRRARKLKRIAQPLDVAHRIDRTRQAMAGETPRRFRRAPQILEHVPELGRFFEIEFLGRFVHFVFNGRDHLPRVSLQEITRLRHALAIQLGADLTQARRHLIRR